MLAAATGWPVRRRLQEGRADDTGDLEGVPFTTCQVKDYADVQRAIREALDALDRQQVASGDPYAVAFVRRRGGSWLAVTTAERMARLLVDAAKWREHEAALAAASAARRTRGGRLQWQDDQLALDLERSTQDQDGYPGGAAT